MTMTRSVISNILEGIGSIFDLSGSSQRPEVYRGWDKSPEEAIREDWHALGEDFRTVLDQVDMQDDEENP
jgi:hypothetical protein